ncbi:MAG TPA: FAD/NAD(P)-binding protein [Acidimicrobiales bacterium]|nr:FAD/NAD(P)-binding protein [Acidimicrobiales bacterium]
MKEVALVGAGAWGLCALERLADAVRTERCPTRVHVVEAATPGPGVYALDDPEYLLLNTPCGQLSLYPWDDDGAAPRYGLGLYEWAKQVGYRWNGESCRVSRTGREVSPHDYLPRRVLGAYLQWFFETLVEDAPSPLEIVLHRALAVDVVSQPGGLEHVRLDTGEVLAVDHVILTTGHTANLDHPEHLVRPYPVTAYVDAIPSTSSVGVIGMGLVAIDAITALTVGNGGSFVEVGDRLRYRASGREPQIYLFSRSGFPYCAKAVEALDETDEYASVICTSEAVAAIRADAGRIDLRTTMLPLIFAEMQARYYLHSAALAAGPDAAKEVRGRLEQSSVGDFESAVAPYAARYGSFDASRNFFAPEDSFVSATDYEDRVYAMIEADLNEALKGPASAVKAAYEVLRFQRDAMRTVIEFGGLSLESYLDFQSNIRTKVSRLVAGPPAVRSQQLLALMNAGVVKAPFGPAPRLTTSPSGRTIRSRELDTPFSAPVDFLIQGYLEDPTLHRSSSPLLTHLYQRGRLQQFKYGDTPVGSVELSRDFHPIDRDGHVQEHLSILGALTEGVRYFTHYLPSPKSRLRVFLDAQRCVEELLG